MKFINELNKFIRILRGSPNDWLKNHLLVMKLYGNNESQSAECAKYIREVQQDMFSFAKDLFIVLTGFIFAGIIMLYLHWYRFQDIITLYYLTANYLGVVGTFLGSYGFLFYRQDFKKYIFPSLTWNHDRFPPPLDPTSAEKFIGQLLKYINAHLEEHTKDSLAIAKLEIRRQLTIFSAFILMLISMLIPIILKFY